MARAGAFLGGISAPPPRGCVPRYNDNRIMDVLLSAVTINYLIPDSGQVYYYIVHERKLFARPPSRTRQSLARPLSIRSYWTMLRYWRYAVSPEDTVINNSSTGQVPGRWESFRILRISFNSTRDTGAEDHLRLYALPPTHSTAT